MIFRDEGHETQVVNVIEEVENTLLSQRIPIRFKMQTPTLVLSQKPSLQGIQFLQEY